MLASLARYYDVIAAQPDSEVAKPGWGPQKVFALIEIDEHGSLKGVIPCEDKKGWVKAAPFQEKRSSGVKANLLCDTTSYFFGRDAKGKPQRALECFNASKEKHLEFLNGLTSREAVALRLFFQTWNPANAEDNPVFMQNQDVLFAGRALMFSFHGKEIAQSEEIANKVSEAAFETTDDPVMTCLVDGKKAPIARLHPSIKGVVGAQSSGAALVGFNSPSFESYGHNGDQGLNAPVSSSVVFKYSTALNYLLASPKHRMRIGDTTVVFWSDSEQDNEVSQDLLTAIDPSALFNAYATSDEGTKVEVDTDKELTALFERIAQAKMVHDPILDANVYVLGLAPNASRLAVRFFYKNSFGAFIDNIKKHYERMQIAHAPFEKDFISPYWLVRESENPNAKVSPATSILGAALMRSILTNTPYPAALYENILLRIKVSQDDEEKHTKKVTYGKAAFIKAYLIKNHANHYESELTMGLNSERESVPYLLGRLFAVLEHAQYESSGRKETGTTITSRYFNAACATPASVFPVIMKLNMAHMDKLHRESPSTYSYLSRLMQEITSRIEVFPKRLSLVDQGDFILGYWAQRSERFKKRDASSQDSSN
jgi:CRISPR-associated protein Csd1